jgi:hypothetical protein
MSHVDFLRCVLLPVLIVAVSSTVKYSCHIRFIRPKRAITLRDAKPRVEKEYDGSSLFLRSPSFRLYPS